MPSRKHETGRISIFKGREARLNRAIFDILALKGPLTIYDMYTEVRLRKKLRHVRYATVNKRVRLLERVGCIEKIGTKKTKAGFEASIYELATKAYLGMLLNCVDLEDLFERVDETTASTILAIISYTLFCA